jgi:hypothetical protein
VICAMRKGVAIDGEQRPDDGPPRLPRRQASPALP